MKMKTSSKENEITKCIPNTFESESTIHEKIEFKKTYSPNKISNEPSLKTSSFYSHAQPCPFTFLTAVKCKFSVAESYALHNRIYRPDKAEKVSKYSMDPVEPLNVPNLQISSKVHCDAGKIESLNKKLLSRKSSDSSDKPKLNNTTTEASTYSQGPSSTITTTLKSRNFESLRAPNIKPLKGKTLSKNNSTERDSSRNKENRLKRIKKEDVSSVKSRNDIASVAKCSKKHIPRKDIFDKATNKVIKNDNILNRGFKDNGNAIKKPAKTNKEKPYKYSKFSARSRKEISVKSDTCSTGKSIIDKDHQKSNFNANDCKVKDNSQESNVSNPNVKPALLQHPGNSNSTESIDMISQDHSERSAMANVEKNQKQSLASLHLVTSKQDSFNSLHIQQNNVQHDCSTVLSTNDSNQFSNSSIIETKLSQDSLSEKLMDPDRISFRDDSYSNQPEFNNLVTPNVNLTIRSKRRKHVIQLIDSDDDYKDSKLSKKDQIQGVEVQAKTENNLLSQFVHVQKATDFIEGSAQDKISLSSIPDDDGKDIKNWSAKEVTDRPSHLAGDTQTEAISCQYGSETSLVFSKESTDPKETFHVSLNSGGGYRDDISLSKKMRTMSEISLHETTSSIRTESGTEISISLRDVTCSFNKNLDLEMAQLIDDERQRYNKIEMLFKSREKSLNDRTRKLVKLEEQKKVLRDTGQDSRISSVKKKQRALLLKLQQEKDEMNRLKELHKIASQERKLMLQKQRDMFNPDMSTKNILHKLKRSADSQSPRRLSGPMKGYDIRSNSSMSSLIDSDKSQLDRSKFDCTMNISDVVLQKENKTNLKLGIDKFPIKVSRSAESHDTSFSKIKFDERMPKSDMKYQLYDFKDQNFIFENVQTKSNALIQEFTEIWQSHFSQNEASAVDNSSGATKLSSNIDDRSAKRKGLKWHKSKKSTSSEAVDEKSSGKNSVQELVKHSDLLKERNEQLLKDIVDERNNFAKQSSALSSREQEQNKGEEEEEEEEGEIIEKSDNVSVQSHVSLAISHQSSNDSDKSYLKSVVIRSQQDYQPNSSFKTSKKLEQILKAREATLISRRNCVEEWIAWHARLRDEEERVSRMEKAAYKLVSASAKTLSLNDTAISSDNSDVEGRIELLTKKLSDRRFEMTRLKKEARKQAKRRLRALEANLMTQIKRYDATINDMRKKLETKKGSIKESTKSEIESKSVDEYRVPDIPIKNIQEIYKRSGLLRSQSADYDVVPVNRNNDARDESDDIEPTSSRVDNSHKSHSQSEIQKSKSSNISGSSLSKVGSIESEKNTNDNSNAENNEDASPSILSSKLSHIQLHNSELNDDIHNLENDLKQLSEMMLNFSKKSSDQNSVSVNSTHKSKDELKRVDKSNLDIDSDTIDTDLKMRVKETLSNGIPDTDNISTSIEELYSEIKSKDGRDVPESSEKSIETEELHRMSKSLKAIDEKDYKSDTCSILEIISTTVDKDEEESMVNELDCQAKVKELKIEDDDSNMPARSTDTSLQNQSELDQLPIENKNEILPLVPESAVNSDNVMTELDSFHDKNEGKTTNDYDRNSISDVEDSTIFVPKGESTNLLETFVLKLDNSSDIGMGICSEEFNDILEIIERETKNDEETDAKAHCEQSFGKERRSTLESEMDRGATNSNDQCGQTIIQSDSLNEAFEHAKVHGDENDSSDGEQTNNLIEVVENKLDVLQKSAVTDKHKTHVTVFLDKTLQVIRDPEYDDISEESLEVSDIFNNTNPAFHRNTKKFTTVPEKYIIKSESDKVLRILDEISNKSNKLDHEQQRELTPDDQKDITVDTNKSADSSSNENVSPLPFNKLNRSKQDDPSEEISSEFAIEEVNGDKSNQDSRLDVSAFKDNSVNNNVLLDEKAQDSTAEFRTTPMGVSSEKDIETMIKKLKASLDQPGIEVAELEAKLLEIENLQIELAIKKLEAEEVSYYVREIPNKPPPPYTPPGSVRQSGSNGASSSISIIPTNIEELTFVTEKATAIIHVKKKSGEDVQFLEAPDEIYENVKDPSSDAVKKNRLIYNTFLFDLCKELVIDIYKVEEENPGPSWTKPQVKTKRVIKIPKSVDELNEYVSKEVATLFGFKTKLQRENMVMRWSRKRRDRVDELLAKEAQAEEKEWTKFHHDELAVKNELTVTILNNLLMETTSCIKNAYAKKRKLSVL